MVTKKGLNCFCLFFFCLVLNLSSTLHKSSVIQLSQTSQKHLLTLTLMNVPRFAMQDYFQWEHTFVNVEIGCTKEKLEFIEKNV